MKILITGGMGFIGLNLIEFLLNNTEFEIISLDKSTNIPEELERNERIKIINGTLEEKELLEATRNVDYVVHLAAQTSVIKSVENPKEDAMTNIIGLINLLNACVKNQVKKVVFASSGAVLGEQEQPINEDKVPKPSSPYGASKHAGEGYCSAFSSSHGLNITSLRFSNVYGPKSEEKGSAVSKFIRQALNNEKITIYGDGEQTRDLIHVSDICNAISLSLTKELQSKYSLFQIGSGTQTSVNKLYRIIKEELANNGINTPEPIYAEKRKGEVEHSYFDIEKARKELGYRPKISVEEGVKQTVRWFLDNKRD